MPRTDSQAFAPLHRRPILGAGIFMIALGVIGLVVGWVLIQSLTSNLRGTLAVTRSAVETISETVEVSAELAQGSSEAMSSASRAASDAATATRNAASGILEVSSFLRSDLPENIEAIQQSLPGAIEAARAIDTTLGALSLIGLDYSPKEPLGDSLRRIQLALVGLPDRIRDQSEALESFAPASEQVAEDVAGLATELDELGATLAEVDSLTESYSETVQRAETAVGDTEGSLATTVLTLRVMLVLSCLGAIVLGYALITIDRRLGFPLSSMPSYSYESVEGEVIETSDTTPVASTHGQLRDDG